MPFSSPRRPLLFLLLAAATVVLGLASRSHRGALPAVVGEYAGDVLWAAMVLFLLAALRPAAPTRRLALAAAAFALAVEVSQLFHAPWIDAVRRTRAGGLVLGHGFLASDLACYAAGIALAAGIHAALARRAGNARPG